MSFDGRHPGCPYVSGLATFVIKPATASVVVQVIGEIDVSNAAVLAARLQDVIDGAGAERTPRVILDLSELRFLDASGLAAMADSQRLADSFGARLELAKPSEMVRKLLRITQLDGTLPVVED